jgi:hypothetical protein
LSLFDFDVRFAGGVSRWRSDMTAYISVGLVSYLDLVLFVPFGEWVLGHIFFGIWIEFFVLWGRGEELKSHFFEVE